MKSLPLLLVALVLLLLALLVHSCNSPAQANAAHELAETIERATADGIVTQEEADLIAVKMRAFSSAPGVNWGEVLATGLGTLAAAFVGLRYVPNRHILGSAPDPDVARAAGLPPIPAPG